MPKNPQVYLDISIGGRGGGRVVFELFYDLTPRTAENFRGLCTGEYGVGRDTKKRLCYQGCNFFRSVKDFMVQSGDFQFNTGDGGESIYGGTFNDEDFARRHTQAGVLSMANKGRNTNASQFFITLKKCQRLDGKHIAFGQVVDGMDVIRAISKVPIDRDEKPRVPITIVGCGETGSKRGNMADPTLQLSSQIAKLAEEAAPVPQANAAQKAKAILKGGQGGAATDDVGEDKASARSSQEAEAPAAAPPKNERERKLFELRMKMNQGRVKNNREVIEEQKRASDPDYARKQTDLRYKRGLAETAGGKDKRKGEDEDEAAEKPGAVPKGKDYLNDTVEHVEMRAAKKKKGNPDAFGWDVFNQDSLYRAHDKRTNEMKFDEQAYREQQERIEGEQESALAAGFGFQPSEQAKTRLQEAMDKMTTKKKEFSRRRTFLEDEDTTYVNDRNRHFNKKLERAFGAYTEETRQNLERGTAL